jgi:hypothetical protein
MSTHHLMSGDRVRLTAANRQQGYQPGDQGTVVCELAMGLQSVLYFLVAMDKDDPSQTGQVFTDAEIEPDV